MRNWYAYLRNAFLLLLLSFFATEVFAQTGKITGQVKDANGQPLSGASVQIRDPAMVQQQTTMVIIV